MVSAMCIKTLFIFFKRSSYYLLHHSPSFSTFPPDLIYERTLESNVKLLLVFGPFSNKINIQHQYWVVILLDKRSLWLDFISHLSRSSLPQAKMTWTNKLFDWNDLFFSEKCDSNCRTWTLNRLYICTMIIIMIGSARTGACLLACCMRFTCM